MLESSTSALVLFSDDSSEHFVKAIRNGSTISCVPAWKDSYI